MKKIALLIALSLVMFQGTVCTANADAETDLHQVYIAKIQAKQVSFSERSLFEAITNDNSELVKMFMLAGMNPNATYLKVTALNFASSVGSVKSAQILIDYGAEIDKEQAGVTPLMFAINRKQAGSVDVLISNGADVNKTLANEKPVNYAIKKKQYSIAKALLNAGATVDDKTVVRAFKTNDETLKKAVLKSYTK